MRSAWSMLARAMVTGVEGGRAVATPRAFARILRMPAKDLRAKFFAVDLGNGEMNRILDFQQPSLSRLIEELKEKGPGVEGGNSTMAG